MKKCDQLFSAHADIGGHSAIAATAHPAKFESIVEPLIGRTVAVPATLSRWLDVPARAEPLVAEPEALATALRRG